MSTVDLNNAWKKTCKVLFGEEIGDIEEYADWLSEIIDANVLRKSTISGKAVAFSIKEYAESSKWISFDEIDQEQRKKFEPLNINEIKDIDSIRAAISDRVYYCGDIILGNSKEVVQSSNITDGFCVYDSAQFFNIKYVGYSTVGRENSYCFGSHAPGGSEFIIRCSQTVNVKRAFELLASTNCSDCYYVYGLDDCSDCLFSFTLKNKRNCIGNLEIDKDKFNSLKAKILAEIVEELKHKKRVQSLLDIVRKSRMQGLGKRAAKEVQKIQPALTPDKRIIERAFSDTTKLLFGRVLDNIDDYGNWLLEHTHKLQETKSALSRERIVWQPYGISLMPMPEDRLITLEEAHQLEKLKIPVSEAENISIRNAHESIGKIAFLKVDLKYGNNVNMIDSTFYIDSSNCYKFSMTINTKYCAYGMWANKSHACFGVDSVLESNFCLKCYHSTKLTRCFEMDNCKNCSDSMFCHNCENIHDSMFCFNTKNKRYAVGNVEYPAAVYAKLKTKLLEKIANELEKHKKLEWSIYNIGAKPH